MKILLNLVMVASLLLATGCGSLGSRWRGGSGAYQGVRFDCEQVVHHSTELEVIAALDIPLSAIVDTLFLPYDLATEERETLESAGTPTTASTGTGRVGYK